MTKRYDEYKDSGIGWLGEIPSHWVIKKLKNCNNIIAGQSVSSSFVFLDKDVDMIPFIQGSSEFNSNTFNPVYKNYTKHPQKIVNKDTLLMSVRAPVGELNISQETISIGRGVCGIIGNTSFNRYLFEQMNDLFHANEKGTTFKAITNGDLKNLESIYPPESEQQAIATYLDNKTSKIDSAVAELTKQKDLLIELKKSTIHQAVTKGLDSTVEMKDSGVDWIGEVPESWDNKRIKDLFFIRIGKTPKTEVLDYWSDEETEFPWIPSGYMKNTTTKKPKKFLTKKGFVDSTMKMSQKNTTMLALTGATCGKSAYCEYETTYNQSVASFYKRKRLNDKYYFYFLLTLENTWSRLQKGGAHAGINSNDIKFSNVIYPDRSEQDKITVYLDKKTGQIDQSIEVIDNQIAKMKEYKKTLINDVVTGKIKVA